MYKFVFLGVFMLSLVAISYSPDFGDYWVVNGGGGSEEIDEFGTCRIVNNTASNNIFTPVKTSSEWTAFYTNAGGITGISVGNCPNCSWQYDGDTSNGATTLCSSASPTDACTCGEKCLYTQELGVCLGSPFQICDGFLNPCPGGQVCIFDIYYYECREP